jgi:prepilin-type processing-associated H-X9-DG protein
MAVADVARRRGFIILELLVVVAATAVLAALLSATVVQVRRMAARSQCNWNLRQVGTAISAFAVDNNTYLPQFSSHVDEGFWVEQTYPYRSNNDVLHCVTDNRPFDMGNALALGMRITDTNVPWWRSENNYLFPTAWRGVALSYRGSETTYRPGGYSQSLRIYERPQQTMLLDEAWDNWNYGARLTSAPQDIWPGYVNPLSSSPPIDFPRNTGLRRHGSGANWLFADFSVRTVDEYDGPAGVSYYVTGSN